MTGEGAPSAAPFWPANGSGEGIRTLDPSLGKVMPYP